MCVQKVDFKNKLRVEDVVKREKLRLAKKRIVA